MPFIHIRSLPFEQSLETPKILKQICLDFSMRTGISTEHVTATWEYFAPEHYAVAGDIAYYQLKDSHPILVRLLIPSFNSHNNIEVMLTSLAEILSKLVNIPTSNLFIQTELAQSGLVFDSGNVVHWNNE